MPMPRLLKRLSRKSLRKRSQSLTSASELESEPTPPLPGATSESGLTNDSSLNFSHPPSTPWTPNSPNGQFISAPPPQPPILLPPVGSSAPQDDFSKGLQAAWASATTDPKVSKTDKVLQTLENGAAGAMAKESQGTVIMAGIKTGLDAVGGMEAIEKGLNAFMDGMPVLMNALDEVAKLHPFIGVAVMAFKAVWALEQKRRDNDRKILALHMEMKEMMGVLTQLKNVKDSEEVAPDGSTIKGRMQVIVTGTAEDIKACANTCDTYSKKKLVVKVLKGPIWEGRLVKFVGIFTKRRSEFEFALSIHTALGVDAANKTLLGVDAKIDMMMKMFQQFASPAQKEMSRMIEQRGGAACLDNDAALRELNDHEVKSEEGNTTYAGRTTKASDLADLKADLHTDPDAAIEQNMVKFTRKFEVQKRQIIDELSRVIEHQGDRIISAVTAGPHDRIIDPNVHLIWKEMGWRGSVKARHFVMALRDHFQEEPKLDKDTDEQAEDQPIVVVDKADQWALEYINVVRLQQISEAFDDDASGFVTVAEANAFTTMRPLGWSLPHWLAYWGAGHHQAMQIYVNRIGEIIAKMFAILPDISPLNKSAVNEYLKTIYINLYTLTASVNPCYVNDALQERFMEYVTAEEARIRGKSRSHLQVVALTVLSPTANLEAVQYDIDASDTLELVTGKGRIDRFVLPLITVLLERHFEIFRVCQKRTVHPDELWDAADTLRWVFKAVDVRVELLQSTFKQQKLDLTQQFKSFSHGLYEYSNQLDLLWNPSRVQEMKFAEYTYDDSVEAQDMDATKILNYAVDQEPLDFDAYGPPQENREAPPPGPLGQWHGYEYSLKTSQWPDSGMISMFLEPSSPPGELQHFTAADRCNRTDFKVVGEYRTGIEPSDTVAVSFQRSFPARYQTEYFIGTWNAATETLTGTTGFQKDPAMHTSVFVFKRTVPEHLRFAPAPVELEINKARALWEFAIAAVRHSVRRDRWAWAFFEERRDIRRRFIELYIRTNRFGAPTTDLEDEELSRLQKYMTTADGRFYHSLAEQQIRATPDHGVSCDNCGGNVGGARVICLVCQITGVFFNTVDFCETNTCFANRMMRSDMKKPHLPHHDLMKVRRVIHWREFGRTYSNAKEALEHARKFFQSPSDATASKETDCESKADTDDEEGHAPPSSVKRLSRIPALGISIPQDAASRGLASGHPKSAMSTSMQVPDPLPRAPLCRGCTTPVIQPCWYCVQCEAFICWDCDAKGKVSFENHHFHAHDLVRVQDLVEEKDLTLEERLTELEGTMAGQFTDLGGRMAAIQTLLEQLLNKPS
ncbi:hypothetical protein DFH09DRAFT_1462750 [Mycena vulgaris]|nr:hypothetical protein DFH09DRAFT_1462750 [Mycena vulgaris]